MIRESRPKEFNTYLIESTRGSLIREGNLGVIIYAVYCIADYFYIAPLHYATTWSIRFIVVSVSIAGLLLTKNQHPITKKHPRILFLLSISFILNSYWFIWYAASDQTIPADASIPAMTLMFCMSFFVMLRGDALLIGGIFVVGFCVLLGLKGADQQTWITYLMALGGAYVMGALGAMIGETYTYHAYQQERSLREETNRADRLIERTFPQQIANELKHRNESPARRVENVSVLFCDIVDFTLASSKIAPEQLVSWLSQTFSLFDRLVDKHGCEKIKTIGDAYMAVAGVPNPAEDHADRIVALALDIQENTKNLSLDGKPVRVRIGINSGPVVAGVIGEKRFAYDLWGDTVNIASRMESLAPPGSVQITESTKQLLGARFPLKKVSPLEVKGKGNMEAWLVEGPVSKIRTDDNQLAA